MTIKIECFNRDEVENIFEKTNEIQALPPAKICKPKISKPNKMEGASLVEYALLVALIAVICIITIRLVGQKVSRKLFIY